MSKRIPLLKSKFVNGILVLLLLGFFVSIVRTTIAEGHDFAVYWRAARRVLCGEALYSVESDGFLSFKYPPWIAPLFFPFALFELSVAKGIWGVVQAGSLIYSVFWLLRRGLRRWVVAFGVALFAGLWTVHALLGQVILPLLALGLALGPRAEKPSRSIAIAVLTWGFSVKIFTGLALFGLSLSRRDIKPILGAGICLFLLSIPALVVTPGMSPVRLVQSWTASIGSSEQAVAGMTLNIKGRDAQSLPSLVIRLWDFGDNYSLGLTLLACLSALGMAGFWSVASRNLREDERWVGWLAITAVIQPLGWMHSFILAFPLAVFSLDRALSAKRIGCTLTALVGVIAITAVTAKTFGAWGEWFEWFSVKSWGVLFCALVLAVSCGFNPFPFKTQKVIRE